MTTQNEAREAVYQEFVTGWGVLTPYVFDDEPFDPEQIDEFVRLTINHLPSAQRTLGSVGNRRFTRNAIVFIQVFTAAGQGTKRSDQLTITARDIFEGRSFGGLSFSSVNSRRVGPDGKFYQALIEAFFDYDETK